MRAVLTVDMGNAAFEGEDGPGELKRILVGVANRAWNQASTLEVLREACPILLRDSNGNRVGELRIEDDRPACDAQDHDSEAEHRACPICKGE